MLWDLDDEIIFLIKSYLFKCMSVFHESLIIVLIPTIEIYLVFFQN